MPPPAPFTLTKQDSPMDSSSSKGLYGHVVGRYNALVPWGRDRHYAAVPKEDDEENLNLKPSSLSYPPLPSRAEESKETSSPEASPVAEGEEQPATVAQTALAWACMALAILAGASIGPVFKYMMAQGVTPLLAASWRNQTMVLSLLPFALCEAWHKGREGAVPWLQVKPGLPFPIVVHVLISGISWAANLLFWIVGLQYISTFKASVVASSHPVLLVLAMRATGHAVSLWEGLGVCVAFGGMFLSEYRGKAAAEGSEDEVPWRWQLFGLSLCLLAAAGEVVTIVNRIQTRRYVPLLQYTLATSFIVALCATGLAMGLEGAVLVGGAKGAEEGEESGERGAGERGEGGEGGFSVCYADDCLLGWASQRWRVRMLLFGLWVGAVCITGFNYAMQYIPPLVFSALSLLDPAVTAFLSFAFGLEPLPSLLSWLGGGVVLGGVGLISLGERERERKKREEKEGREGRVGEKEREKGETEEGEGEEGESGVEMNTLPLLSLLRGDDSPSLPALPSLPPTPTREGQREAGLGEEERGGEYEDEVEGEGEGESFFSFNNREEGEREEEDLV